MRAEQQFRMHLKVTWTSSPISVDVPSCHWMTLGMCFQSDGFYVTCISKAMDIKLLNELIFTLDCSLPPRLALMTVREGRPPEVVV